MRCACAAVLLVAATSAWAGPGKAGLWEITMSVNFTQGGPQISPDQLEKMKSMGIAIPGSRPMVSQRCVTPEMAARDEPPKVSPGRGDCTIKDFTHSGTSFTANMVCTGEVTGEGNVHVDYESNASYKGVMDFTGTSRQSGPVKMHNEFAGKWLGDDCGNVKPPVAK
jgi:hypothetical protein